MKKKLLLLLVGTVFTSGNFLSAQITFQKTYDTGQGRSVQQTTDGGYIITGDGYGVGLTDIYLIKTDANGDTLWTRTIGDQYNEWGHSVQQTSDGGYIVTGIERNMSFSFDEVYLIKTDPNGDTLWTRTYGGSDYDVGCSVQQTTGGGYIISGTTSSFGGTHDVYLIKTDAGGNLLWTKTYSGTTNTTTTNSVQQTDDGYIIAGSIHGVGAGQSDVSLLKTDMNGNALWIKTFGGIGDDYGKSVQQTTDGGYIIAGSSYSSSGTAGADVFMIKTNANGDTLWTKTYGGTAGDLGNSVQQTLDDGYIIGGSTSSFGGSSDLYLIKTDLNGDVLWSKTYGGTGWDDDAFAKQTADGGYIISGSTTSFSGNSVYLIKTDSLGNSGCNEGNPATIVTSHSTQVTIPVTITTSTTTIVTTPANILGNGGTVTTLCTTVGVVEILNQEELVLFPNPFSDKINITTETNEPVEITLFDITSRKILQQSFTNSTSLNTSHLSKGLYIYELRNKNGVIKNGKVVKD